jgi:hypothetical protein
LFSTPIFSQWFWKEHYYEIPFGGEKYYSKGKPRIEGEFTVFNKWPENLEWRIKTQHVKAIKDIGPISPEELEAKAAIEREKVAAEVAQILSIFKPLISENGYRFRCHELKLARDRGYSDDEIWSILIKENQCYAGAQKFGLTLERIAKFFDQEVKY